MSKACAIPLKFQVESPVHALQLARKLIGPYKRWTVGMLGTTNPEENLYGDMVGEEVKPKSAKAEAFCALGALQRVNTRHYKKALPFLQKAAAIMQGREEDESFFKNDDIFAVNDVSRDAETHRNVLKMFTKAIQLARRAERAK